jgi:hypothetical protein
MQNVHLEAQEIKWMITLKWILGRYVNEDRRMVEVAQDRSQVRDVILVLLNFRDWSSIPDRGREVFFITT